MRNGVVALNKRLVRLYAYDRLGMRQETFRAARAILNSRHLKWLEYWHSLQAIRRHTKDRSEWAALAKSAFRRLSPYHKKLVKGDLEAFLANKPRRTIFLAKKLPRPTPIPTPQKDTKLSRCLPGPFESVRLTIRMMDALETNDLPQAKKVATAIENRLGRIKDPDERANLHDVVATYYVRTGDCRMARKHWSGIGLDSNRGGFGLVRLVETELAKTLADAKRSLRRIRVHREVEENQGRLSPPRLEELAVSEIQIGYLVGRLEKLVPPDRQKQFPNSGASGGCS